MGRESRLKKIRNADPARAERVRSLREGERQMQEALDRVLKAGKDLGDRMHYDKLSKDTLERVQSLLAQFRDLIERERLDLLGACFDATHKLRRECETLEDELDRRKGRPPKPDPLSVMEPLLAKLPREQANAVRFVTALNRGPAPPAPETTDAFEKGRIFVQTLEANLAALRRDMGTLIEIAEERVRRGWGQRPEIDRDRAGIETSLGQMEGVIPDSRQFLESLLADYESLHARRRQLRQALAHGDLQ